MKFAILSLLVATCTAQPQEEVPKNAKCLKQGKTAAENLFLLDLHFETLLKLFFSLSLYLSFHFKLNLKWAL